MRCCRLHLLHFLRSMLAHSLSKWTERIFSEVILEEVDPESVQFNVYHETGFEMDVFDANLNLNIELDGPRHMMRRC